jgi:hypothetical protein
VELQILLWCVLAPAIISLAFVFFSIKAFDRIAPVVVTVGWCVAVAVSLYGRQSKNFMPDHLWPQDAWQQVLLPIAIGSVALALVAKLSTRVADACCDEVRWLVAGLAATLVATIAMPSGDGWTDMLPLHRLWIGAIISSSLMNLWLLDRMSTRGADRWVLWVALAGLGSPAILAASAFAGLAEWVAAAIVSTLVMAIAASWRGMSSIWCALYPAVLFAAAAIASGRFYTYEEHPTWVYSVMLFVPSLIAVVNVPLESRSTAIRVGVALTTALLLLGCVAWTILGGSTEEQ